MYMIWTGFGCLIFFINSIVWKDNVTNWAPVWCDIGTSPSFLFIFVVTGLDPASCYLIGGSVGIPASSLCIIRRLYYITKLQFLSQESKEVRLYLLDRHGLSRYCVQKWWEVCTDISIGIGFPCVVMILREFLSFDISNSTTV